MASRKLLVVTGNYGVVQRVRESLGGEQFAIHIAYSHLDALYQLKYETFDLVLVDSAMVHRNNGEQTAAALARLEDRPPLLVYTPPNGRKPTPGDAVVSSLEEAALFPTVARMLQLPGQDDTLIAPLETMQPKSHLPNTSIFWRDEEMQTLFALGRSLTEVLELSEVLNRVVEAARHLTNAEQGMILLPDGQTGQLYLRARVLALTWKWRTISASRRTTRLPDRCSRAEARYWLARAGRRRSKPSISSIRCSTCRF